MGPLPPLLHPSLSTRLFQVAPLRHEFEEPRLRTDQGHRRPVDSARRLLRVARHPDRLHVDRREPRVAGHRRHTVRQRVGRQAGRLLGGAHPRRAHRRLPRAADRLAGRSVVHRRRHEKVRRRHRAVVRRRPASTTPHRRRAAHPALVPAPRRRPV